MSGVIPSLMATVDVCTVSFAARRFGAGLDVGVSQSWGKSKAEPLIALQRGLFQRGFKHFKGRLKADERPFE